MSKYTYYPPRKDIPLVLYGNGDYWIHSVVFSALYFDGKMAKKMFKRLFPDVKIRGMFTDVGYYRIRIQSKISPLDYGRYVTEFDDGDIEGVTYWCIKNRPDDFDSSASASD